MDRVVDDMVVTRRLTADEIDADILVDSPDLTALAILRDNARVELPVRRCAAS